MRSPIDRRHFLTTAAAVTAMIAGCSASDGDDTAGTTTTQPATQTDTPTASDTPGTPSPNEQQTTTEPATNTPTPTIPTETATPTLEPITLDAVDEPAIQTAIAETINGQARDGLDDLTYEGSLSEDLIVMAQEHSLAMAKAREVAHEIDGVGVEDRYSEHDLSCRFLDNDDQWRVNHLEMEAVGAVGIHGTTVQQVADTMVAQWLEDTDDAKHTLTLKNAGHIGIGVKLAAERAWVTANLCA